MGLNQEQYDLLQKYGQENGPGFAIEVYKKKFPDKAAGIDSILKDFGEDVTFKAVMRKYAGLSSAAKQPAPIIQTPSQVQPTTTTAAKPTPEKEIKPATIGMGDLRAYEAKQASESAKPLKEMIAAAKPGEKIGWRQAIQTYQAAQREVDKKLLDTALTQAVKANAAVGRRVEDFKKNVVMSSRRQRGDLPDLRDFSDVVFNEHSLRPEEGPLTKALYPKERLPVGGMQENRQTLIRLGMEGKVPTYDALEKTLGQKRARTIYAELRRLSPKLVSKDANWVWRGEVQHILPTSYFLKHPGVVGALEYVPLKGGELLAQQLLDPREWILDFVAGKYIIMPIEKALPALRLPIGNVIRRWSGDSRLLRKALSSKLKDVNASKKVIESLDKLSADELRFMAEAVQQGRPVSLQVPKEMLPKDYIDFPGGKQWVENMPAPTEFKPTKFKETTISPADAIPAPPAASEGLGFTGYSDEEIQFLRAMGMDSKEIKRLGLEEFGDLSLQRADLAPGDEIRLIGLGMRGKVLNPDDNGKILVQLLDTPERKWAMKMHVTGDQIEPFSVPPLAKRRIRKLKKLAPGDYAGFREGSNGLLEVINNEGGIVSAYTETGKLVEAKAEGLKRVPSSTENTLDQLRREYSAEIADDIKLQKEKGFLRFRKGRKFVTQPSKEAVEFLDAKKIAYRLNKEITGNTEAAEALYETRRITRGFRGAAEKLYPIYDGVRQMINIRANDQLWRAVEKGNYQPNTSVALRRLIDDIRTGRDTIGVRAYSQAHLDFHNMVWGNNYHLDRDSREYLLNLIYANTAKVRSAQGQATFTKMTAEENAEWFRKMLAGASPKEQRALERYTKMQQAFAIEHLIKKGHMSVEQLKFPFYVSHMVSDRVIPRTGALGALRTRLARWIQPRRLTKAYRSYLKKATGSEAPLVIDLETLPAYNAMVYADNAQDEWMTFQLERMEEAVKSDLRKTMSEDEIATLVKKFQADPGRMERIGDAVYTGYTPERGFKISKGLEANEELLAESIAEGMLAPDHEVRRIFRLPMDQQISELLKYAENIGPRGGDVLHQAFIIRGRKRAYMVPAEVSSTFNRLTSPRSYIPLLREAISLTRGWKRMAIRFGGLPYNALNLFGDTINTEINTPGSFMETEHSVRQLMALDELSMLPTKELGVYDLSQLGKFKRWGMTIELTPDEKEALGIVFKQAVMDASFLRELHLARPIPDVKGFWRHLDRIYGYREAINRLNLVNHHLKYYKRTGKIKGFQFDKQIQDLLPEQAIGYLAREAPIDYGNVPAWYRTWMRGYLFPFFTFYQKNAINIAKVIKAIPTHPKEAGILTAQIATPLLVIHGINNMDPMRMKASKKLGEKYGGSLLRLVVKAYDDTGDGRPNRALIWSPSTPIDEAGAWLQVRRLVALAQATRFKDENGNRLITPEEATKRYLSGFPKETAITMERFTHPVLQMIMGIAANKDPYDGHEIIPAEKVNLPEYMKITDYAAYVAEKWSITVGRFARQMPGRGGEALSTEWGGGQMPEKLSRLVGIFSNGPLNATRAMGLRMIDLDIAETREMVNIAREPAAWTGYYLHKLRDDFITSDTMPDQYIAQLEDDIKANKRTAATKIVRQATEKGLDFSTIITGGVNDPSGLRARLWQPGVWADIAKEIARSKRDRFTGKALEKAEIDKWNEFAKTLKIIGMYQAALPSGNRPDFAETARRVIAILGYEVNK